jgi:hypothetical protein
MFDTRYTCECGFSVKKREDLFGFFNSLDKHKLTEKHQLMMSLLEADPESHALALDPKTESIKCECGQKVYRWTIDKHRQTATHKKIIAKKRKIL